jgi:hypothetical protein
MAARTRNEEISGPEKIRGRALVSCRRMVTASSTAARASSRRPRSPRQFDWLFSDMARFREEGVGAGGGQLAVGGDGFLDGGQGLFPAAQVAQAQ